MKSKNTNGILKKVEELKALLVFSRRIIPFMEDVLVFVKDIVPVVEEIKSSVETSSHKLPKASQQLDKITMATEMASTEILNLVEGIFFQIDRAKVELAAREERLARSRDAAKRIDGLLAREGPRGHQLAAAWQEYRNALEDDDRPGFLRDTLEGIQRDCTSIMIALQVQDITAQQIAAVNKLMESVDEGLNRMLRNFRETPGARSRSQFAHPRLDISFDTAAEYTGADDRQRMADRIMENGVAPAAVKEGKKEKPDNG